MKKYVSGVVWGAVLVVVGILLMLSAFNIIDFNLFFEGWWTLFIIIPCLVGVITEEDKNGYVIGLIVGVLLLLSAQDLISFEMLWKIFVPAVVIVIGIGLIMKNTFGADFSKSKKSKKSKK